jgi:hypothetical protein
MPSSGAMVPGMRRRFMHNISSRSIKLQFRGLPSQPITDCNGRRGDNGDGGGDGGVQPQPPAPAPHKVVRSRRVEPFPAETFSYLHDAAFGFDKQCYIDLLEKS